MISDSDSPRSVENPPDDSGRVCAMLSEGPCERENKPPANPPFGAEKGGLPRPKILPCASQSANPPRMREEDNRSLPFDLTGPLIQLGSLLRRWVLLKTCGLSDALGESSKHQSTAEVFPLPALPWGMPPGERDWMEAAVRALNWLSVGTLALSEGPATTVQLSLLRELCESFRSLSKLGSAVFADVPIESYWRSKGVNAYGEEIHCALSFKWANIEHSLPRRELAGALDGAGVSTGGIKDFLSNPRQYLKPAAVRTWMKPPRVMVSAEDWPQVVAGLLDRRICDIIPLSQVIHVGGKPVLGGLFGVPKNEVVEGVPVLRLIMDLRPINQLFESITGDLQTLPMLSQLFPLEIHPHEDILVSSEDIKAMFYIVGLGECWRPLLAFGREIPEHLRPAGISEPCVLTSRVLPMGFVNSVSVAQALHRNIVNHAVGALGISREAEVRRDQPLPVCSSIYRVYLDNFDLLERKNREAAALLSGELSAPAVQLRSVYQDLDVPVNEKKSVKAQLVGEMQGGLVDGHEGTVSPKPDKVARYLRGAWCLLQSGRSDLKRIQMVAGGLVYLFSYKRCLMSCLNEVWQFIASFGGQLGVWKPIPEAVHEELFCCLALSPLACMDLRAPYDATVTASDASETGGGLSFSAGLTQFGVDAVSKSVRGLGDAGDDDRQVLVISLYDNIAACRVALDVLGAKVSGYIAVEPDVSARRVVESSFASTLFVQSVEEVSDSTVRGWACQFSRAECIIVSSSLPLSGTSMFNDCHVQSEVSRIRGLSEKYFPWADIFVLVGSLSSLSEHVRASISRGVGILPYELDAVGITPCRRCRLFWFNWKISTEEQVEIEKPLTARAEDYGRINFLLDCPPDPYLTPGWSLAGGAEQKLPTFTAPQPKAQPGFLPTGIEGCTDRDISYWRDDRYKFAPYHYRYQHGLIHPRLGWRMASINEREAMLGFPLDYTLQAWSKSDRKKNHTGWEDCRLSLLGNSMSVQVVAFLLKNLLAPRKLCENMSLQELQRRCQPGASTQLGGFLVRPPWTPQNQKKSAENEANLIRKLGSLMSTRGTDVLLQANTEPLQTYDRLRTSVPAKLWFWRTACGWKWKTGPGETGEHINRLELRAVLTSIKWRVLKQKCRRRRFLHLVDSLVSLHIVNKGRSSSRKLRRIMKRISAWLLLSANSCVLGYVDTGQNPADAPSRRSQKRKWSGK